MLFHPFTHSLTLERRASRITDSLHKGDCLALTCLFLSLLLECRNRGAGYSPLNFLPTIKKTSNGLLFAGGVLSTFKHGTGRRKAQKACSCSCISSYERSVVSKASVKFWTHWRSPVALRDSRDLCKASGECRDVSNASPTLSR